MNSKTNKPNEKMNRSELRELALRVHGEFSPIHEKYPDREFSLEITRLEEIALVLHRYRRPIGATQFLDIGCGSGHVPLLGSLMGLES